MRLSSRRCCVLSLFHCEAVTVVLIEHVESVFLNYLEVVSYVICMLKQIELAVRHYILSNHSRMFCCELCPHVEVLSVVYELFLNEHPQLKLVAFTHAIYELFVHQFKVNLTACSVVNE